MAVVLALASALCYGFADLWGGLLSRRAGPTIVAFTGQASALVLTLCLAPILPSPEVRLEDLAWGALSGLGTGLGMVFLYRGLSRGDMSVVVPLAAVAGTALPVLAGVTLLREQPSGLAWTGIIVALPALWLVSTPHARPFAGRAAGSADALWASIAIAVQYVALGQAGAGAGLWPIVAGRAAASLVLLPVARPTAEKFRAAGVRTTLSAAAVGAIAALALTLYMLAAQLELLTIAVVLSSLYPVVPVLVGILFLRERLTATQVLGLGAAGIAVVMITAG